ncbi:E3 ubiquitin-protein ligase BRE1A-like isoform X2 [Anneissia japonica]|uniref:E3 ubiquitin-protein ligase BRE1A-like isoform X2 n=1 Tax=Anneissia japonica TaxID=1529436 RepID=UPI00142585F6|nr:E3 ubiquitin-protein ligase BRE1A-like isoform X2 [Anneissia japonica]
MASKRTAGEAAQDTGQGSSNSSSEEPPTKKFHIEPTQIGPVSSMEELDIKVLKVQNKKLMDRLEQRQLLENELRNRIESLQQRQRMDESLLGMVNKYWTQLDEDIKILVQQFTMNAEMIDEKKDGEEKTEEDEKVDAEKKIEEEKNLELEMKENRSISSFLAELMTCDHSEIDQLLLDRCQFSKKVVANLLKAFDVVQQKYEKLVWKLQGGTAEENKEEIFIGVNADLEAENKRLRTLVSDLQAKHHVTTLKFTEKTDQLLAAETRVAELTNLMDDVQYDVEKAKLRAFKLEQLLEESYTKLKNRALATSGEYANTQVQGIVSELDDHKDLADKRLLELEKLQEQHQEKIKELEQVKMDLQHIPESILLDTAPYKCLQSQFTVLYKEAQDMRTQLEESRNLLATTKNAHFRQIEQMESDELTCQKKLRLEVIQLEDTLAQVRKEYEMLRIEFEQNLAANEQAGPINRELRHLVSSFQNHNQQLKGEINRYKRKLREAHLEINKLRHEASRRDSMPHGHSSSSSASTGSEKGEGSQEKEQLKKEEHLEEKKEKEKEKDREKMKEVEKRDCKTDSDTIKDLKAQLKKSQENQKEMKLLLDMYKGAPKEQREKAMLLAAEKRAKAELEELRARVKQLEDRDQKDTRHLSNEDAMRKIRSMDELVHQLQRKLADRKQEEEALLSEMDVTGQAFEDMQEQNTRLLQQLREKDDANFKLMSERIKSNQIHKLLREEKDVLADQVNTLQSQVDAQNQVVRKLEEKERILQTTLGSIEKELTLRQNASELNRKKAMENSQSTADLKLQYEKLSKQVIDLQKLVKENSSAVEQENHKFRRSQEEIVSLKRKVERYKRIELTSSADEVLMEEIRTYKDLLTCPCCKKGRKNVILSKCYHVFCFDCIKTRYETRQRKCPKCNAGFGANDYHRIWLDS